MIRYIKETRHITGSSHLDMGTDHLPVPSAFPSEVIPLNPVIVMYLYSDIYIYTYPIKNHHFPIIVPIYIYIYAVYIIIYSLI